MSWMLSTTSLLRPATPAWLDDVCQRLTENNDSYKAVELIHPRMDDRDAKTFAKALSENTTVASLVLSCYAIVDDGTAAIASVLCKNTTILKLQLRDIRDVREVSTFFQYLKTNRTITDISLRHCTICPRGATVMAQYVKQNTALHELRITDSQFISDSFQILCKQGLYCHPSIQRLYFVNDDLITETSAEYLANIFDQNNKLQELHIGENNLGDDGVVSIAQKIIENNSVTTLRHLDVRSNNVTCNGAMALQGLIVNSTTLWSLDLSNNNIGDFGMMALCRGLQQPKQQGLRKLNVSANCITNRSATGIAIMLRMNQTLKDLNVSFNALCDDGVATIASALSDTTSINIKHPNTNTGNATLRTLSLRHNDITNIGAHRIAHFLPCMKGLKELLLSKNKIDCVGITALLDGLSSNVELEYLDVDNFQKVSTNPSHDGRARTSDDKSYCSNTAISVQRNMAQYLKFNKAGRRIFRSINTVPRGLWTILYDRISTDKDLVRCPATTAFCAHHCFLNPSHSPTVICISCSIFCFFITKHDECHW
jgi:Ran GTPase-activating protein (RanGAP) involved in mRNA processing and transport